MKFGYEDLEVWNRSVDFAVSVIDLKFKTILAVVWKYFIAALLAGLLCAYVMQFFDVTLNCVVRLLIAFAFFTCLYLLFLVGFYKGLKPIKEALSIIKEVFS